MAKNNLTEHEKEIHSNLEKIRKSKNQDAIARNERSLRSDVEDARKRLDEDKKYLARARDRDDKNSVERNRENVRLAKQNLIKKESRLRTLLGQRKGNKGDLKSPSRRAHDSAEHEIRKGRAKRSDYE
jgi:hypothetical protein